MPRPSLTFLRDELCEEALVAYVQGDSGRAFKLLREAQALYPKAVAQLRGARKKGHANRSASYNPDGTRKFHFSEWDFDVPYWAGDEE